MSIDKVMVPVEVERINEALAFLCSALNFAYQKGLHEIGYDPITVIHNAIAAAPKAEPIYQMRQISGGAWVPTDADGETCLKRMPHWRGVFEFRTLYVAPNSALTKAEQPQSQDVSVEDESNPVYAAFRAQFDPDGKGNHWYTWRDAVEWARKNVPAQAQDERDALHWHPPTKRRIPV